MRYLASKRFGFTIVELMIVIIIIGILSTIVAFSYQNAVSQARTAQAKSNAYSVQKVAEAFFADKNRLPTKASDFSYNPLAKIPEGVRLLGFGEPLSSDNGLTGVDYEYVGTSANATGARVLYWDFGKKDVARPIIYIGNIGSAGESSSDWRDLDLGS